MQINQKDMQIRTIFPDIEKLHRTNDFIIGIQLNRMRIGKNRKYVKLSHIYQIKDKISIVQLLPRVTCLL